MKEYVQSVLLEKDGFVAKRMAPALLNAPMDPFLSITFTTLEGMEQARPLAGYSEIYIVLPSSQGDLEIETSLIGSRSLRSGESLGLSTGRGVVARLRGLGEVSFIRIQINTPREKELQAPSWFPVENHADGEGIQLVAPNLSAQRLCIERCFIDGDWEGDDDRNYIIYHVMKDAWCASSQFSGQGWFWIFGGVALQEPIDPFSSLAMSDRMRNRLVIECYKKGLLGRLD